MGTDIFTLSLFLSCWSASSPLRVVGVRRLLRAACLIVLVCGVVFFCGVGL